MRVPAYRSVNKGSRRKTETCRARPDFRAETSPMAPKRSAQPSTRETFEFPRGGLANETVPPKKYSTVTFGKDTWLKIKENDQFGYGPSYLIESSLFGSVISSSHNISASFQKESKNFFPTIIHSRKKFHVVLYLLLF